MRQRGARGSSGQGRGGCELHARRGRGEGGREQLGRRLREEDGADSPGPRAERAGKAGAGKAVALTGGPARAERGEGEGRRARDGPDGPKGRGGGGCGLLSFFFYSGICFPFSFVFSLSYLHPCFISDTRSVTSLLPLLLVPPISMMTLVLH